MLCVVFWSLKKTRKKCVYFVHNCLQFLQLYSFAYTTYKPSHHNHSIIPLSNHHTIIILKSHNLRNICIYTHRALFFFKRRRGKTTLTYGQRQSSSSFSTHLLLSLSLSLFRCFCSLSFYDLSDDKKHTREENVVFRGKKEE